MIVARFIPQEDGWGYPRATGNPLGELEWDATDAFSKKEGEDRNRLLNVINERGEAVDDSDGIKAGPNAPEWIRNWTGPFSIFLRQVEAEPKTEAG
jgi:hypothetical protein